jgi:DNA replicative helicase MCM subunit Mcm2 (Cdc46/Mcm family)
MSILTAIKSIFGLGNKTQKLSPGDRLLYCEDCRQQFVFDEGEQRFFKSKGFSDPKRCPNCRKSVKSKMKNRRDNGHRSHHKGRFRKRHHNRNNSPYVDEP